MDGEHTPYENDVDILDAYNQAGSEEEFAAMLLRELDFNNGPSAISSYNGDEEVKLTEKQPNYLQPTMASVLPPFLGGETERVRNSYRTGSYNTIKRLPDQIQPGHIRQNRKQHITENLLLNSNNVFKPTSIKRNELLHRPEYIGTDFDKMKNVNRYWQDEERVQTDSLSRKPFVITSRIRSKTEDIFHDPEYKFPGMGPGTGLKKLENMVSVLFLPCMFVFLLCVHNWRYFASFWHLYNLLSLFNPSYHICLFLIRSVTTKMMTKSS